MTENLSMKKPTSSARWIAEGGICIALAKVLDLITIFRMPQGGSVTLGSMAPLFFFAIRWGWKKGLLVGGVYGLVNMLLGGYVVHPLQLIFDYPLAFAMCGLAGIPQSNKENEFKFYIPWMLLGTVLRYLCHVISGCIFFGSISFENGGGSLAQAISPSNWANSQTILYSLSYNLFLLPDLLICFVIIGLLWKSLKRYLVSQ